MGSSEQLAVKPLRFSEFLNGLCQGDVIEQQNFAVVKAVSELESPVGVGLFRLWEQVGSREQTSVKCQSFLFLHGCSHKELHDKVVDGVSWKGKDFMRPVFNSCDRPTCCKCKDAWAGRQAKKAELRLNVASARFGLKIEHFTASLAPCDYGLPYKVQKENTRKAIAKRGIIAYCLVPHPFRGKKRLREGFHFHGMGLILDNAYDRCRHCVGADCSKCDGFEGLTNRLRKGDSHKKGDGYIVKVFGERKTIGGTLAYELGHAGVLKGVSRFHVLTWGGLASYNNMPHVDDVKKLACPICDSDLGKHRYIGVLPLSAFKRKGSLLDRMFDAEESGEDVYIPMVKVDRSDVEEDGKKACFRVPRSRRSDG